MADATATAAAAPATPAAATTPGHVGAPSHPDCLWTDDAMVQRAVRSEEEGAALLELLALIRAAPVPEAGAPPTDAATAAGSASAGAHPASDTDTEDEDEPGHGSGSSGATAAPAVADDELSPFSAAFDRSASTALRFLRARDGDVALAMAMWTDSLQWRVSSRIAAKCRRWAHELARGRSYAARTVRTYWYGGHLGVDRRGAPVNLVRVGRGDPAGLVRECSLDHFIQQYVITLESGFECLRRLSEQKGEWQNGFIDIYDMGGDHVPHWTARAFGSTPAFKSLAKVLDSNYPERVLRGYVVRTPWIFEMFWKMFKGLVPKATVAKIGIYHSKWTNPLREFVADDNFAPWLLEDIAPVAAEEAPDEVAGGGAAGEQPQAAEGGAKAMTAEEAAAVADAAAAAAAAGGGGGGGGGDDAAAAWRPTFTLPGEQPLRPADFRPDHDFPGGVVPKRARLEHDAAKAVRQCAVCGRPTARKHRKQCKSCGAKEFVPYKDPAEAEAEAAQQPAKSKGWFSGFWGS